MAPAKVPSPAEVRRIRARGHSDASGMMLAGVLLPLAIANAAFELWPALAPLAMAVALGLGLMLGVAGFVIPSLPRLGRWLASIAVLGTLGLAAPSLVGAPFVALLALLVTTGSLAALWNVAARAFEKAGSRRRPVHEGRAQGAASLSLAAWLWCVIRGVDDALTLVLVLAGMGIAAGLAVDWALRERLFSRKRSGIVLLATLLAVLVAVPFWGDWRKVSSGIAIVSFASLLAVPRSSRGLTDPSSWWEPLLGHPARLLVGTFAGLSLLGTLLLALPLSASSGASIGFVDALFTATSAVCVTGLIVLDTPVAFSSLGQVVILLLIQVGGIGIMAFSTLALWAFGQRMSLRHEGTAANLLGTQDRRQLFGATQQILALTFAAEAVGAVLLSAAFIWHGDTFGTALWRGVFTAISAFCNAGFALQSDSLIPYQGSPLVLHTVGALIVLGGISPLVVLSVPRLLFRTSHPVPAQARLALAATVVLLVVGFGFTLILEWNQTLGHMPVVDRFHNAWFQSVTLRTAGFNSVDFAAMRPATLVLAMLWMFVGGSPGGTAGGVKTTTASILCLSVLDAVRGKWTLDTFGKRVPEQTRAKAAVVVSLAAAMVMLGLVAILLTQSMPTSMAAFEVVSALGTVGLSIGATSRLDEVGRIIIVVCMFVGRVGALTLLMFLSTRRHTASIGHPEENIDVG